MASRAGLSGLALGEILAGVVLAWSGIENAPIAATLQSLISGRKPSAGPATSTAGTLTGAAAVTQLGGPALGLPYGTVGSSTAGSGSPAANKALARLMAASYGWVGVDWQALDYGWGTLESGFRANARNPGSGAFGIAQALGHGTPATVAPDGENEYGPDNGITAATARAANSGSAAAQIAWGLAYIKATYGSPSRVPGWLGQGGYNGY